MKNRKAIITQIISLFNQRNYTKLVNYLDDNIEVKLPNGLFLQGKEQVLNKWQDFATIFPDINYHIQEVNNKNEKYIITVLVTGTFKNNMVLPNNVTIKATHKSFKMPQRINMTFNAQNQLLFEHKEYDLQEFYNQLNIKIK